VEGSGACKQADATHECEDAMTMVESVIKAFCERWGEDWPNDEDANLRFTIDVEHLMHDINGAHLIGDPELDGASITLRFWVDVPLDDLMSADVLAYEIFGRISEEIFFSERMFEQGGLRYQFVTGSARHGHVGSVLLSGPHAAEFADRFRQRVSGGIRYHA
jgi:hypothetical protein